MIGNKPKGIMILTTQRSGSTMICEDMWSTKVLGFPEEYLIPWALVSNDKHDWLRVLDDLIKYKSTPNGVFSIKVMANQIVPVGEKLLHAGYKADDAESAFFSYFSDFYFIRIWREDKLKQAISRVIAEDTGICHATALESDEHFAGQIMKGFDVNYNGHLLYERDKIDNQLCEINNEEHFINRLMTRFSISPMKIIYEIAVSDKAYLHECGEVFGESDVDISSERRLVALSNKINKEWYARYLAKTEE